MTGNPLGMWVIFDSHPIDGGDAFVSDYKNGFGLPETAPYYWRTEVDLMERARQLTHERGKISTTLLQCHLRIGYQLAARLAKTLQKEMPDCEAFI